MQTPMQPSGPPPGPRFEPGSPAPNAAPPAAVSEPPTAAGADGGGRRLGGVRGALVAGVSVVVIGGLGVAGFLTYAALHGKGDALTKMVPADTDVFATVYLSPSASQRQNLDSLIKRFPHGSETTDQTVTKQLDQLFKQLPASTGSSQLSFSNDIKPWLGSQLGVVASFPKSGTPDAAVLINSKDDAAAQRFLTNFEKLPDNSALSWSSVDHNGVSIREGRRGGQVVEAHSYVDHTAVLSGSESAIAGVIDTDQGRHASIASSDEFKRTEGNVPSDRLVLVYANAGQLIQRFQDKLGGGSCSTSGGNGIAAFRGVAVALSAQADGAQLDTNLDIDTSKLTDQQKQAQKSNRQSTVIDFMPRNAYGFVALTTLDQTLQGALDALSTCQRNGADVRKQTDRLGLTGNNGLIGQLTGDAGVEVNHGSAGSTTPQGALLIGVRDEAKTRDLLRKLTTQASGLFGSIGGGGSGGSTPTFSPFPNGSSDTPGASPSATPSDPGASPQPIAYPVPVVTPPPGYTPPSDVSPSADPTLPGFTPSASGVPPPGDFTPPPSFDQSPSPEPTAAPPRTSDYKGVTITSVVPASADSPFALSYAVFDGMAVIATSPAEVQAVVDAHRGHAAINTGDAYRAAVAHAEGGVGLYIDVTAVIQEVRSVAKNLDTHYADPVKSVVVSGKGADDHVTGRLFVEIR